MATKKKPPQYRAKSLYANRIYYGNLFVGYIGAFIISGDLQFQAQVDPDTIQKFCGYDKDGNAVYVSYKPKLKR